jgi:hypothetical protein
LKREELAKSQGVAVMSVQDLISVEQSPEILAMVENKSISLRDGANSVRAFTAEVSGRQLAAALGGKHLPPKAPLFDLEKRRRFRWGIFPTKSRAALRRVISRPSDPKALLFTIEKERSFARKHCAPASVQAHFPGRPKSRFVIANSGFAAAIQPGQSRHRALRSRQSSLVCE